jgi:hypothetical protein
VALRIQRLFHAGALLCYVFQRLIEIGQQPVGEYRCQMLLLPTSLLRLIELSSLVLVETFLTTSQFRH